MALPATSSSARPACRITWSAGAASSCATCCSSSGPRPRRSRSEEHEQHMVGRRDVSPAGPPAPAGHSARNLRPRRGGPAGRVVAGLSRLRRPTCPQRQYPELTLSVPLGDHRLIAKFDLLAIEPGGRAVIVDWKTGQRRQGQSWLAGRLQTRVYRYVLAQAGAHLNDGAADRARADPHGLLVRGRPGAAGDAAVRRRADGGGRALPGRAGRRHRQGRRATTISRRRTTCGAAASARTARCATGASRPGG